MKYFEHYTTAHNDIKLKRLKKIYGMEGIGIWWSLCEIVGLEGVGGYLEFIKYPKEDFAVEWNIPLERVVKIFEDMADIGLIDKICLPTAIFIQKLIERADEYTKKQERQERIDGERFTPDTLPTNSRYSPKAKNDARIFIYSFINKHKEYIGTGYAPNWGRDAALMKELHTAYGDDLEAIIDEFLKSAQDSTTWWADKVSIPVLKSCATQVVGRLRKK